MFLSVILNNLLNSGVYNKVDLIKSVYKNGTMRTFIARTPTTLAIFEIT